MQSQNFNAIVREKVVELVGRLPENTPENREELYNQVRTLFERRYPQHMATLDAVIAEIERKTDNQAGDIMPPKNTSSGRSRKSVILGIVIVAALAAGGGWYAWQSRGSIQDFDRGITGYAGSVETLEQIPANFSKMAVRHFDGDTAIEFTGPVSLFAIEPVSVDPSKRYQVKARVRVITDDPSVGGAVFNAGVATFDASGALQTSTPGTHRYAAASGRTLKAEDGWVDLEGEITGTGNQSPNQFREGTKTVRPVIFLNYRSPNAVSQITSLTIQEIK